MKQQELIRKKRDGKSLNEREIKSFISGVTGGKWADYQISALLMAMFINGLSLDEQNALTREMLDSGERLEFSDIDAPIADKHSTGGVGDKTSLIIAPLVAACGVAGSDDFRSRSRAHGRNARQTRINFRLQRQSINRRI
jgi:thymidine phosphorylase